MDAAPALPRPTPSHTAAPECRLPSGKAARPRLVAEDSEDFALMDLKMTRCPANRTAAGFDRPGAFRYVHLLAIPRRPTSGVEDRRAARRADLWRFAWETARAYLPADDLVLAANPPGRRTQDQLHVHATRFAAGAKARFFGAGPAAVGDLRQVWKAAERQAAREGARRGLRPAADGRYLETGRFGIAVARDGGGFAVLVVLDGSPEGEFSQPCAAVP